MTIVYVYSAIVALVIVGLFIADVNASWDRGSK
jgi:hypothetical protein